jgi:hypothetical protein
MQLRIEPPEAKRESYSDAARRYSSPMCNTYVLDFVLQHQELAKWCWAAIAASVGRYYGAQHWHQHEVASALLGFDYSRFQKEPEVAARCDAYAMLDEALRIVGCYSHWSPGRPTFERIRAEIDAGRPLCLRVEWYCGGSHYVVVTGYYADTREIYLEDSLHGPSVQAFDTFPGNYRMTGGVWRETFWTSPPLSLNERRG